MPGKESSHPSAEAATLGIDRIVADPGLDGSPLVRRVRDRLPRVPFRVLGEGEPPPGGGALYLKRYLGRFLRFCPGTHAYNCCGYRIVHIGESCPLDCSYCVLKAYFRDSALKVWANQEDLFRELEEELGSHPDRLYRAGTGEFTDSLALEGVTGYTRDLLSFLAGFPNICLELKTKTADLSWMDAARRPDRVLPAWSLNAPEVVEGQEGGVAGLEARLSAARECARRGFRVCLHFDPVIYYPGWQRGYAEAADMIFDYLRPRDIAYLSLGSFRGMPELKRSIARNRPDSASLFHGEFVRGLDGKMRLLRPLRVRQLSFLAGRLRRRGLEDQLYLCMESDEVWRSVLGRTPGEMGGLARHLLQRAFGPDLVAQ
jgi:spore photoproduct lyase